MKKRSLVAALLIMLMAVTVVFAGCGGPSNLEEWLADTEEGQQYQDTIDTVSANNPSVDIYVEGNTLVFATQMDTYVDDSMKDYIVSYMEPEFDSMYANNSTIVTSLEEASGIDGIQLKLILKNSDGSELVSKTY